MHQDTTLQQLKRNWFQSRTTNNEVKLLQALIRNGKLDERDVEILARCGHKASGKVQHKTPDSRPDNYLKILSIPQQNWQVLVAIEIIQCVMSHELRSNPLFTPSSESMEKIKEDINSVQLGWKSAKVPLPKHLNLFQDALRTSTSFNEKYISFIATLLSSEVKTVHSTKLFEFVYNMFSKKSANITFLVETTLIDTPFRTLAQADDFIQESVDRIAPKLLGYDNNEWEPQALHEISGEFEFDLKHETNSEENSES